jgi:hypothetical protein
MTNIPQSVAEVIAAVSPSDDLDLTYRYGGGWVERDPERGYVSRASSDAPGYVITSAEAQNNLLQQDIHDRQAEAEREAKLQDAADAVAQTEFVKRMQSAGRPMTGGEPWAVSHEEVLQRYARVAEIEDRKARLAEIKAGPVERESTYAEQLGDMRRAAALRVQEDRRRTYAKTERLISAHRHKKVQRRAAANINAALVHGNGVLAGWLGTLAVRSDQAFKAEQQLVRARVQAQERAPDSSPEFRERLAQGIAEVARMKETAS